MVGTMMRSFIQELKSELVIYTQLSALDLNRLKFVHGHEHTLPGPLIRSSLSAEPHFFSTIFFGHGNIFSVTTLRIHVRLLC